MKLLVSLLKERPDKLKTLVVITGPTASGKTSISIEVAKALRCEIISADSRQMYYDIPIATAAPTKEERAAVAHHFVGTLALDAYYSAACFEEDVMSLLPKLFSKSDYAVLCGGSMLYVDAVTKGIDDMPTISDGVRQSVAEMCDREGSEGLLARLRLCDPEYYEIVDRKNTKRVAHALEIIYESGKTYTSFRTGKIKNRDFRILKFAIDRPREELYERILSRVINMVDTGLENEVRRVYKFRELNSLNTVGVKEMLDYIDGKIAIDEAMTKIARNTRVFAKKQLTWLKKDSDIIKSNNPDEILSKIQKLPANL